MNKTHLTFKKYEPYFNFFLNRKKNNYSTWENDKKILALLAAARESITSYVLYSFSDISQDYIEHLLESWHDFLYIKGEPKMYSLNSGYLKDFIKLPIATGRLEEEKHLKREFSEAFEEANKSICSFYINKKILKKLINEEAKNKDESILLSYALNNLIYHINASHFSEQELANILSLLLFDKDDYNLLYKIRKSHSQTEEYKKDLDNLIWKIRVMLEKKEGNCKIINGNLKVVMEYYLELMLLRATMTDKSNKYQQDKPITFLLRSKHYLLDELINIIYETNNIELFLGLADEFHIYSEDNSINIRFNIRNAKNSIGKLKDDNLKLEVYNILIDRLSAKRNKNSTIRKNLKDLRETLEKLKDEMNDSFLLSEVETYCNIALTLYESGKTDRLKNTIDKIRGLINKIKNVYFYKENAVLLLVQLLTKTDHIDEAIEIIKTIEFEIIRTDSLAVVSKYLIKKGEIDKAIELSDIVRGEQYKAMTIYPVIVAELIKMGNTQRAINLLSKKTDDNIDKAENFKIVVEILARKGLLDNAIKALFTKGSVNLDKYTQSTIEFLEEAICSANKAKGYLVQSEVYSIIVTRLVKLGFVDEAVEILSEKVDLKNWEVETCYMIINDLKKAGRIEDANKIADEAIKALEKVEGYDKAEMYSFVVASLAEIGREEEARKLMRKFHEIIDKEIEDKDSDDFYKSDAYTGYAYRMAEIGRMDEAIRYAESLTNDNFRSDAYFGIADIFIKSGKIEEAIDVSELIDYSYYQAESYANIAKKLAELGEIDRALEIANKADYVSYKIKAYNIVSDYLVNAGRIKEALRIEG